MTKASTSMIAKLKAERIKILRRCNGRRAQNRADAARLEKITADIERLTGAKPGQWREGDEQP